MNVIKFLYLHQLKNRIKVAFRKPVTYVYLAVIALYAFMIPTSFKLLAQEMGGDNPAGMAAVLTVFAFWLIPGNLIAYAKRKGLIFRNSDIHFLFPSPMSPKKVLLYSHIKGILTSLIMNLVLIICGGVMFRVDGLRLLLYFLFSMCIHNVLEGCIMLILYGGERLTESGRKLVVKAAYALLAVLVVIGFYAYLQDGLSMTSVSDFLHSDAVQMVPIIGWYIAVVHLLFMGATTANVIGTVLYAVFFIVVVVIAIRMKCTGAYYEDAIRFAEDYEEVLENRRQGGTDKRLGKKTKYNKAKAVWKGAGAKALYYRQMLEYKKSKYFIFDANTVAALIAGAVMAYLYVSEEGFGDFEAIAEFIIPALSAYMIFIFTTLTGKWGKELKSPYTYMIPDSAWKKLWYSTVIQHIQSIINGALITLPLAVLTKMSPVLVVLCVLFYVLLSANKLYALAVAEIAVGSVLGTVGKQFFQLFIQGITITFAILGAVLGYFLGGVTAAYLMMDFSLLVITISFMILASLNFEKLETA